MPEVIPLPVPEQEPVPILAGSFAIYETPEGGMHAVAHIKGEEDERHFEMPAFMLQILRQQADASGGPFAMMRALNATRKQRRRGLESAK